METVSFEIRPAPPFRLDLTAWALRRRGRNLVDRWDGATYHRVLVPGPKLMEIAVTQTAGPERPRLEVTITGHVDPASRPAATQLLTRILGLRIDLQPFYAVAAGDRRLRTIVEQFRGLKPPRFPSIFEALVNAVACQQLSLTVGIELLNRLAMRSTLTVGHGRHRRWAFPGAEDLLRLKPQTLRSLGFSYNKASSLLAISRQVVTGGFDPEQIQTLDDRSAVEKLMELRGVGRWSAEYALLRGAGRIDVFPGDDVGARNRLAAWLSRDRPLDYDGVKRAVRRWQPYAGLLYFHLLLAGLAESGELSSGAVQPDR